MYNPIVRLAGRLVDHFDAGRSRISWKRSFHLFCFLSARALTAAVAESEPNDTLGEADVLALGEDPAGSGYSAGFARAEIDGAADIDYWSLSLHAGDTISVAVETEGSGLDAWLSLRNAADAELAHDSTSGPGNDPLIPRYTIATSGAYYIAVRARNSATAGTYAMRVDLVRGGLDLERDPNDANDTLAHAEAPTFAVSSGKLRASMAGAVGSRESTGDFDEDIVLLGNLSAGATVEAGVRLPASSTLAPYLEILDANGTALAAGPGPVSFHLVADGAYYVRISNQYWVRNGHRYDLGSGTWDAGETFAQTLGGHLATIDDADENAWLLRTMIRGATWIGLSDAAEEGNWTWSSGAAAGYTNWAANEPGAQDYAYITTAGTWRDGSGSAAAYIAESADPQGREYVGPGIAAVYILDAAVTDPTPPRVVNRSRLPADGGSTGAALATFSLTVSEDLDAASVNSASSYDLRERGADGVFDTGDDVIYAVAPLAAYTAGTALDLLVAGGPLPSGTYRFRIHPVVTDRMGNALDGNGDGTGGDRFTTTFTVSLDPACAFEGADNETRDHATALAPSAAAGDLSLARGQGSVDPAGDEDWWSFNGLAGQRIAVAVDTPDSSLDPTVWLFDSSGSALAWDHDGGPSADSYISDFTLPADGAYFIRVGGATSAVGAYRLRLEVVQGSDLESDRNYANDGTDGADPVALDAAAGSRSGRIAGTIMDREGGNTDQDTFRLGELNQGNTVRLTVSLPADSTLVPRLTLLDASGTPVADGDGNPDDASFEAAVPAGGAYYARIESRYMVFAARRYIRSSGAMTWAAAEQWAVNTHGGHLASLTSAAEQNAVWTVYGDSNFWIGYSDAADEGVWQWSDGAPAGGYENWYGSYPRASSSYNYAYVSTNGGWLDAASTTTFCGVAESADPQARAFAGPGDKAQYSLDILITDPTPPQIAAVSRLPAAGGTTSELISSFVVTANEALAPATVNAANACELRKSDDTLFDLQVSPEYASGAEIGFLIADGPLPAGTYTLTLFPTLTDVCGNALDGNGDGTGGDAYAHTFTIAPRAGYTVENPDNGAQNTATPLALVQALPKLQIGRGLGSIDPANDADYWSFAAQAGERVAISADTPTSALIPRLALYSPSGAKLRDTFTSGPDGDAFISGYELTADGVYTVRVSRYAGDIGNYHLTVSIARDLAMETDAGYANDSPGTADPVPLITAGGVRSGSVTGHLMLRDDTNRDEDCFSLGLLNAGNQVEFTVEAPAGGTAAPRIQLLDAAGNPVPDEDGDDTDLGFQATLPAAGAYTVRLSFNRWVRAGRLYTLADTAGAWSNARAWAQGLGGDLVVAADSAEQEWLYSRVGFVDTWLGLRDEDADGVFTWVDNSALTGARWAANQPAGSPYAYAGANGYWYAAPDTTHKRGLAEMAYSGTRTEIGPGEFAQYILNIRVIDSVPPRVTGISRLPAEGGATDALPASFTVTVSENLAPATLNTAGAFTLVEAGPDGQFDTGDETAFDVLVSPAYASGAAIDCVIDGGPLLPGRYRLTLHESVTDAMGNALDGNGDGAGGDAFVRNFSIDSLADFTYETGHNGSSDSATPLPLAEPLSGLHLAHGLGSIDPSGDVDWWSFTAQAGDRVDIAVDARNSSLDPSIALYRAPLTLLVSDSDSGPDGNAYISGRELTAGGTYYIKVYGSGFGDYQLRLGLARGIDMETDAQYNNKDIAGADPVTLGGSGTTRTAKVAGAVMHRENTLRDIDTFSLGLLNRGNTVTLAVATPGTSTLAPKVQLFSSDGTPVPDEDGDSGDAGFTATLSADDTYYAQVESAYAVRDSRRYYAANGTRAEAEAWAQTLDPNAHLATIHDAAENQWLNRVYGYAPFWIGLHDLDGDGVWTWADGAALTYESWYGSEPNSGTSLAYAGTDGAWRDSSDTVRNAVVETADPQGRAAMGPGPRAEYVLDIQVADLIPPTVAGIDNLPDEGESMARTVAGFTVNFSECLAPDSVVSAWSMLGAGPDGELDTADDIPYTVQLAGAYTGGTAVQLLVTPGPLPSGTYRLTADSTITDAVGNALDGNGDGTGGDPFTRTFRIELPPDETYEGVDNDALATATAVPLSEPFPGYLLGRGIGSIEPGDDVDWWKVQLVAGDRVGIAVDTPESGLDAQLGLYDPNGDLLESDSLDGPETDPFISAYAVPATGDYLIRVSREAGAAGGAYHLRIEVGRGVDLESDAGYRNGSPGAADPMALTPNGIRLEGVAAGTIMAPEDGALDMDYFALGVIPAGRSILLGARLPPSSELVPIIEIRDAANQVVALADNPSASVARADVVSEQAYFAVVIGGSGSGFRGQYLLDALITDTTALGYADLAVPPDSITHAATGAGGGATTVSFTVGNYGTSATPVGLWTDRILLSTDALYGNGDDVVLGSIPHSGSLAAGASYTVEKQVFLPPALSGAQRIIVVTDVYDEVAESLFEGNNAGVSAQPITLQLPDLAVAQLAPAESAARFGSVLTVQFRVRNNGASAAAGVWDDAFWLSRDTTLEKRTDIRLATVANSASLPHGGEYQHSVDLTLPLNAELAEGAWHILAETDANAEIAESAEDNNVLASSALTLTMPDLPNLAVSGVEHVPPTDATTGAPGVRAAAPGVSIPITWTTTNTGAVALNQAQWAVAVDLSDDAAPGQDRHVADFVYTTTLAPGAAVTRTEQLQLPDVLPSGTYRLVVRLDVRNDVLEEDETDNLAMAADSTVAPHSLTITLPSSAPEGQTGLRGAITRSGDTSLPLTVHLDAFIDVQPGTLEPIPDATEITLPNTVTIPAGEASVALYFNTVHDGVVDGTQSVNVRARADFADDDMTEIDDLGIGFAVMDVRDTDRPSIALALDASQVREGESIQGTITIDPANSFPQTVQLDAYPRLQVFVPATVDIPAGAASVRFTIEGVQDDVMEKPVKTIALTARLSGYGRVTKAVNVEDDDLLDLDLEIDTDTVTESAAGKAATGRVRRSVVTAGALKVYLSSSDRSVITVPASVTIPGNQAEASFPIYAVDDTLPENDALVVITAMSSDPLSGFQLDTAFDTATLMVLDDDGPSLDLTLLRDCIAEGHGTTATVRRVGTDPAQALEVTLTSDDAVIQLPDSVTIPPGETAVDFAVNSVDNGVDEGSRKVLLRADAAGLAPGVAHIGVTDAQLPDLQPVDIVAQATGATGEAVEVSWTITNQGNAEAKSSWLERVFLSTDDRLNPGDILVRQLSFDGTLPAGFSYNRQAAITLPGTVETYYIIVQVDPLDSVLEAVESNNEGLCPNPIAVQPAYTAVVHASESRYTAGHPIPLAGTATLAGRAPAASVPVTIYIRHQGTERALFAFTDQHGEFTTQFIPLAGEGGDYQIAAGHPGEPAASLADQDSFTIIGCGNVPRKLRIEVIEGQTTTASFDLTNLGSVPLTGLAAAVQGVPANLGIQASVASVLAGNGAATVTVEVEALGLIPAHAQPDLAISSNEGVTVTVPLSIDVKPLAPALDAPAKLNHGMVRGQQAVVEFTLANPGGAATGELSVQLPDEPWLSLGTPAPIPSLAPGGETTIRLFLRPDPTLPLGLYSGTIGFGNAQVSTTVAYVFRNISDAVGDVAVTAVDEFTYHAPDKPPLAGASVVLRDPVSLEAVFEGVTGADGRVACLGVREGVYNLEVDAPKHASYRGAVHVSPGDTTEVTAFLRSRLVTYQWTVEPVELEDRYTFRLESVFTTNVPVPVVTLEPNIIDLAEVVGDRKVINVTIENHGLMAAQNLHFSFGEHPNWKIEPLVEDLGDLEAKSSITVPVTITRLTRRGAPREDADCTMHGGLKWELFCGPFGINYPVPCLAVNAADGCTDAATTGTGGGSGTPPPCPIYDGMAPASGSSHYSPLVGISENDRCSCEEMHFEPKCYKTGKQKADVSSLLSKMTGMLNGLMPPVLQLTDPTFKVEGEGTLCTCCKNGQTGVEIEAHGSGKAEIGIRLGPGKSLEFGFDAPNGERGTAKVSLFAGAEVKITGNAAVEVKFPCLGGLIYKAHADFSGDVSLMAEAAGTASVGDWSGGVTGTAAITGSWKLIMDCDDGGCTVESCFDGAKISLQLQGNGGDNPPSISEEAELASSTCSRRGAAEIELTPDEIARFLGYDSADHLAAAAAEQAVRAERADSCPSCAAANPQTLAATIAAANAYSAPAGARGGRRNTYRSSVISDIAARERRAAKAAAAKKAAAARAGGSQGICAQVRLLIEQEATMTRRAAGCTLEMGNAADTPLTNLNVTIAILDDDGNPADDKFVILEPKAHNMTKTSTGEEPADWDIETQGPYFGDITWELAANSEGSIRWLILPKEEAAANGPTRYRFGGILSYEQNGARTAFQLTPGSMTVYPDAKMRLRYFLQRDVFSDDPFTDEVEPSQPYDLAVLAINAGAGDARNFSIVSAQPRIVENVKGLLIDFEILGAEVDGQNIEPNLEANFGDIPAGGTAVARWLLRSSLQGHFVGYEAAFEHDDALGGKASSLVQDVSIHEMTKLVQCGGAFADGKYDFLVNDIVDPDYLPDTLYLSDGSVAPVAIGAYIAVDRAPTVADPQVVLTIHQPSGWSYTRIPDPGQGKFVLVGVRRNDGTVIPVGFNAWQTDRTFGAVDERPVYENILHLFDYDGTGSYTLTYRALDDSSPTVTALEQPSPAVAGPVASLEVTFSEKIDPNTFTVDDLTLTRDGGDNLLDGGEDVAIELVEDATYRINGLEAYTGADGLYTLTVDASGVTDLFGNAGAGAESSVWRFSGTAPVVLAVAGLPAGKSNRVPGDIVVTWSAPIDLSSFDHHDLTLTRNGGGDLAGPGVAMTEIDPTTTRISGLANIANQDGVYVFTLDATGVQGASGTAGLGAVDRTWTLDTAAPTAGPWESVPDNAARRPLDRAFITVSEPLAPGSFTRADLSLVRNGGAELINNRVTVQQLSATRYAVGGLGALTAADGNYVLTLHRTGIADLAGNPGAGQSSASWTMDATAPARPTALAFSPDTGTSNSDGITNTLDVTLSGALGEPGLRVMIEDRDHGVVLSDGVENGTTFARPLHLAGGGSQNIAVQVVDAAGNRSEESLAFFVDLQAPSVSGFAGVPANPTTSAADSITIILSEPPAPGTFGIGNLSLARDGAPIPLDRRAITLDTLTSTTYKLSGLADCTAENGTYTLTADMSTVRDVAGNTGSGSATATWEKRETNDSPTITLTTTQWEYDEGDTMTLTGYVTDGQGPWTGTVNLGCDCGSKSLTFSGAAGTDFLLVTPVPDGRDEVYSGTVTITDQQGTTSTEGFMLTVHNLAPDIQYFRSEFHKVLVGETVSFTGFALDPANSGVVLNDPLTYTFDFGDGSDPVVVTDPGARRGRSNAEALATHAFTAAGDYTVTLTVADDEGASDTATVQISARDGNAVGDRVWEDTNGNNLQDEGEPGIPNATVELHGPGGALLDATTTDAEGRYRFVGVTGECYLQFDAGDVFHPVAADAGTDDAADSDADPATGRTPVFTLAAGYEDHWDAGFYRTGEIRGVVWQDDDADGFRDPAESARAGCTVYLDLDGSGDFSPGDPTAVTGLSGTYHFTNLAPGVYRLARVPAKDWVRTAPGPHGATDRLRFQPARTLQQGGADIQVDGYSVPVYEDWNADGVRDLLVGEKTGSQGKLRVYLNQGTDGAPVFAAFTYARFASEDDLAVPAAGCLGLAPRMVDWDNDGRRDLLAGLADGRILLFLNLGTDQTPRFAAGTFVQVGAEGEPVDLDTGERAVFEVADWNGDGLFDLIAGGMDGRVRLALNQGAPGQPRFRELIDLLDGDQALAVAAGRSAPAAADLDGDGCRDLVAGDTDGSLHLYLNRGPDDAPVFDGAEILRTTAGPLQPASPRLRPFLVDFNGDGLPDVLGGGTDGKIRVWTRVDDVEPRMHTVHLDSGTIAGHVDFGEYRLTGRTLAVDDAVIVGENSSDTPIPVLANDASPAAAALEIVAVSAPAHGSAVPAGNAIRYTPDPDFLGRDWFTYTIEDAGGASDTATVTVAVVADTDHDGLGDAWETQYFQDLDQGPDGDYDGDGETNRTEQTNGTDPTDAASARDPAHVYRGCRFELYRAANQLDAAAHFGQPWWGGCILCTAGPGQTILSGTITPPGAGGREARALTPAADGSVASFQHDPYANFAALAADFPPGVYKVHLVLAGDTGGANVDLRVRIELYEYGEADFPAWPAVVSPAPGAVGTERAPNLVFDTVHWDRVSLNEPGGGGVYLRFNDGCEGAHHRLRVSLDAQTEYELVVGVPGDTNPLLASRSLRSFTTGAEFRLPIRPGWNLVSIPFATDQTVADLFSGPGRNPIKLGPVWGWRDQAYFRVKDSDKLEPKHGYWVFCKVEDSLEVVAAAAVDVAVHLSPGWNLLGPTAMCPAPFGANISSCVYRWDPERSVYSRVTAGEKMAPGAGYWLKALQETTILLDR